MSFINYCYKRFEISLDRLHKVSVHQFLLQTRQKVQITSYRSGFRKPFFKGFPSGRTIFLSTFDIAAFCVCILVRFVFRKSFIIEVFVSRVELFLEFLDSCSFVLFSSSTFGSLLSLCRTSGKLLKFL